jgi:hypothetical protein
MSDPAADFNSAGPLSRSVKEVIARLAQSLPEGVATLSVKRRPALGVEWNSFMLTPIRPSAAPIHIDVDEDSGIVFLSLGRGAVFEVSPEGRRYSDLSQLDEVRALCLATIRGEFRETVWFKGEDVVGGRGWATVGSEEVGDSWRQLFTNPLRFRKKRSFEYEPYDEAELLDPA